MLVELYMHAAEYGKADTILGELPEHGEELEQYKKLMEILAHLGKNGEYLDAIGTEGYDYQDEIIGIAQTNTPAAARAQNILTILYDSTYAIELATKIESGSPKSHNLEGKAENQQGNGINVIDYKIHPTIINDEIIGSLTLRAGEEGIVEIYSIYGAKFLEFRITEGVNQLSFNQLQSSGLLIYKVWVNKELKRSDKLIKLY